MTTLRALEPTDVDCLYLWENNPEMWRFGFSPAPLSRHQIWEYISTYDSNPLSAGQLRLMIDCDGTPAGAVDLYNIDIRNRHAFVGIMVAAPHRRRGIALEALKLLHAYCRDNLGLTRLAATVAADNEPSLRLFAKAGYALTAVLPSWIYRTADTAVPANVFIKSL